MKRKVFCHIHIPKCAGTSVQWYLRRNFRESFATTTSLLDNSPYSSDEVAAIITRRPDLTCLTGHKLSLDLPFDHDEADVTAITWVRDPVERVVSNYFYHRHKKHMIEPEAKSMSLEDYVNWSLGPGGKFDFSNGQTKFLVGNDVNLDLVRERVDSGHLLLFPMDDMYRTICTLVERFPEHFQDIGMRVRNVAPRDQAVPDSLRKRLEPLMEMDYELLDLARRSPMADARPQPLGWRLRNALKRG